MNKAKRYKVHDARYKAQGKNQGPRIKNQESKLQLREAEIITIHAGNKQFLGTYLLSVPGHKLISSIETLQRGIPRDFSVRANTLIIQHKVLALILVEHEMQLPAGDHDLVLDEVVRFIIILAFRNHVCPNHFRILIEVKN